MTFGAAPDRAGRVSVVAGAAAGLVLSLAVGFFVWAMLNTWLGIEWVRGIATLGVGVVVAGALVRGVILTARVRLHSLRKSARSGR